jgi:hypothetical protein
MEKRSKGLVDLLLLIYGELTGAHVDQQEETTTICKLVVNWQHIYI